MLSNRLLPVSPPVAGLLAQGRGAPSTSLERYLQFLATPFADDNGKTRQPAATKFIDALHQVHARHRPRYDLSACLAGTDPGFSGKVWFWSDLHFFHANIIRYCDRPFADVTDMGRHLMENCLRVVTEKDILVFGGDIAMGRIAEVNTLLRQIPAYKINVLGNHDMNRSTLHPLAVDEVAACLELSFRGTPLFVSHYPVAEDFLAPGTLNLHGHIHNGSLHPALGDGSRHRNMCVEGTGFAPVSLPQLLAQPD